MIYPMDSNRKFFLEHSAVSLEEIVEYLCEGNSKEDLARQVIERMSLKELDEINKYMNEEGEV